MQPPPAGSPWLDGRTIGARTDAQFDDATWRDTAHRLARTQLLPRRATPPRCGPRAGDPHLAALRRLFAGYARSRDTLDLSSVGQGTVLNDPTDEYFIGTMLPFGTPRPDRLRVALRGRRHAPHAELQLALVARGGAVGLLSRARALGRIRPARPRRSRGSRTTRTSSRAARVRGSWRGSSPGMAGARAVRIRARRSTARTPAAAAAPDDRGTIASTNATQNTTYRKPPALSVTQAAPGPA